MVRQQARRRVRDRPILDPPLVNVMILHALSVQIPPIPPGMPPMQGGGQIPPEVVIMARSFFTTIVVIALGIPIIRAITKRFLERPPATPVIGGEIISRLERIEQAVDAMSIEVERISENQRFATKLLAEGRSSVPASAVQSGHEIR